MKAPIFVFLVFLLFFTLSSNAQHSKHHHHHSSMDEGLDNRHLLGSSLFYLDSSWTTQAGKKIQLSHFEGKPHLLVMAYSRCKVICPTLVENVKAIQKSLGDQSKKIGLIFITIDPKQDTPKKLKSFAQKKKMDLSDWTLLSGNEESVRELAAVLGFKYRKEPDGEYTHSNLISLIDLRGVLKHQLIGLNQKSESMTSAIQSLL